MKNGKLRLAMLISGGGTTMQRIVQACQSGELNRIVPACIIVSNARAGGIAKARSLNIPTVVIEPGVFELEESFGDAIIRKCREHSVDIVGQYGWMPKTPHNVIETFQGRMINQHPGPLDPGRPDFGGRGMFGRRVHAARLFFVRLVNHDFWTEATAQRVDVEFDRGPVLRRQEVKILHDDDPYTLQERVLSAEYAVQIETLADFASDRVREQVREKPLVATNEAAIVTEAKRVARLLFPRG